MSEGIIVLIVLILYLIFGKGNKKKAAKPSVTNASAVVKSPTAPKPAAKSAVNPTPVTAEAPKPFPPIGEAIHSAEPSILEKELEAKEYATLFDELEDEEGCLGGSMEHTHDEGEGRTEHEEHLRRSEEERLAQEQALSAAAIRRAELRSGMRKAVVMAEILDKPVSLRNKR